MEAMPLTDSRKGFTQARLLRMGWSRTAIRRNLGEPDIRSISPPACIYSADRVLEAQKAGKARFRRAPQVPEPEGISERFEFAKQRAQTATKMGVRQRSILKVLERQDRAVDLGEIVAILSGTQGSATDSTDRSFYESIRRAARQLEDRGLIYSESYGYRQCYRIGAHLNRSTAGVGRTSSHVVEVKILQVLSGQRKRYSDVVRIVGKHLNVDASVMVCRAVKRLALSGKVKRTLRPTPQGKVYEVLELPS